MVWGLLGALLIGLSLGLMGSGGSIITVPVLTYLVGQEEKVAIAGSLAIVGAISLFAAVPCARKGLIDYRSVLFFGVPGMAGAYLGAYLSQFVSGGTQLSVFAALMLVAAAFMLRPAPERGAGDGVRRSALVIALEGVVVGAVTGFVGVGGGFLIVPSLVLLGGLPMHRAVGTSLVIIAMKSFTGFYKYLDVLEDLGLHLDWTVLAAFSALGILGSFAGNAVGARLPQAVLRRTFALFLILVGAFIVLESWPALVGGAGHVTAGAGRRGALGRTRTRPCCASALRGGPSSRAPEAGPVALVVGARRSAEAQHRVGLPGLEGLAPEQARVLVDLLALEGHGAGVPKKIDASYKNGVLTIEVPKLERTPTAKIPVHAG